MRIYVLSSYANISFAQRILEKSDNVTIESIYDIGKSISFRTRKMLQRSFAEAIVVLIDSAFFDDSLLNKEYQEALTFCKRNKKMLILILLDDTILPSDFCNANYIIKCNPIDEKDIKRTQMYVAHILRENRRDIPKFVQITREKTAAAIFLSIVMAILTSVCLCFILAEYQLSDITNHDSFVIVMISLAFALAITALFSSFSEIKRKIRNKEISDEIASYSKRLRNAISLQNSELNEHQDMTMGNSMQINALNRMLINLEDVKEFYTWSQKQAKAAFALAFFAFILGFSLIGVSCIFLVVRKSEMSASLLTAIGGVVTELIAGTALIVYKSSLSQLNYYHKALHEDERFLSSVNLIGQFSNNEIRDEVLREIIQSEIQMNLINSKGGEKTDVPQLH